MIIIYYLKNINNKINYHVPLCKIDIIQKNILFGIPIPFLETSIVLGKIISFMLKRLY